MLSDPVVVTYNGSAKNLPRSAGFRPGPRKELAKTVYKTSDAEFGLYITQSLLPQGVKRCEILLERVALDPDGPFAGSYDRYPNRFGFVMEVNSLRYNTTTDLGLLRTALDSLVNPAMQARLVGGEV